MAPARRTTRTCAKRSPQKTVVKNPSNTAKSKGKGRKKVTPASSVASVPKVITPSKTKTIAVTDFPPDYFATLPNPASDVPVISTSNTTSLYGDLTSVKLGGKSAFSGETNIDSQLLYALISAGVTPEDETTNFMFYFDEMNSSNRRGSYAEYLVFDGIKKQAAWIAKLNIDNTYYMLVKNGREVKSPSGYTKRLFFVPFLARPNDHDAHEVAKTIIKTINDLPSSKKSTVVFNEDNPYIVEPPAYFSEIVGVPKAMELLFRVTGMPTPQTQDTYFETNKKIIHGMFQPGSLSPTIAQNLFAPIEELHPNFRHDVAMSMGRYDLLEPKSTKGDKKKKAKHQKEESDEDENVDEDDESTNASDASNDDDDEDFSENE